MLRCGFYVRKTRGYAHQTYACEPLTAESVDILFHAKPIIRAIGAIAQVFQWSGICVDNSNAFSAEFPVGLLVQPKEWTRILRTIIAPAISAKSAGENTFHLSRKKYTFRDTLCKKKQFNPFNLNVFNDFPECTHFIPCWYSVPSRISWLECRKPSILSAFFRIIVTVAAFTCIVSAISLTEFP